VILHRGSCLNVLWRSTFARLIASYRGKDYSTYPVSWDLSSQDSVSRTHCELCTTGGRPPQQRRCGTPIKMGKNVQRGGRARGKQRKLPKEEVSVFRKWLRSPTDELRKNSRNIFASSPRNFQNFGALAGGGGGT
jgi:hypothetical protein